MKFFQIVISIVVGMTAGCIPIVGYNMGAGQKQRVKKLFSLLLACEAAVGTVAFLIVEFMPKQLIAIFGVANESVYYTEFAIKAFRVYLCMVILACFCFIGNTVLLQRTEVHPYKAKKHSQSLNSKRFFIRNTSIPYRNDITM